MQEQLEQARAEFKNKLDDEIEQTKAELQQAFTQKSEETKKNNFWMTAITLKIKSMIQQKLAEE